MHRQSLRPTLDHLHQGRATETRAGVDCRSRRWKARFTTGLDSWKVKRIRNSRQVELVPSDRKGNGNDDAALITATVVTGDEFALIYSAIKAKCGFRSR